MINKKKLPIKN